MDHSEIDVETSPLTAADADAVHRLARAAEHVDQVAPLSEQPLLRLRDPQGPTTHLMVRAADDLAGYAQVDRGTPGSASAELVVHPFARHHGVGTALLEHALELMDTEQRTLSVWAHGDLPAARRLAARTGLVVVRELWKMHRPLRTAAPAPSPATGRPAPSASLTPGVTLRSFRPGEDDAAWLSVNARAFASHPEQGRLTHADLQARVSEPWFDAESFLLAERDGEIVGFCWLKVPSDQTPEAPRVGEIYALGVDPSAQGLRLGTALTSAGLDRLRTLGVAVVELYTEGDNTLAIRTYTTAGFTRATVDVQMARPPHGDGGSTEQPPRSPAEPPDGGTSGAGRAS